MFSRILLLIGCAFLLFISWNAVLRMKSPVEKQAALIARADAEINIGTYINAEPFLAEAAQFNTERTFETLDKLKKVYFELGDTQRYTDTLERQTSREDCTAAVYEEYARYFLDQGSLPEALNVIKLGVERTDDEGLKNLYEEQRYTVTIAGNVYDDVTACLNGAIQVKKGEYWGLANSAGNLVIPCEYEQISTYDSANNGCAVVLQTDQRAVTVNMKNQAIAKLDEAIAVKQIGNLSQDRIPLQLMNGKWILANGKLVSNNTEYDAISTCANSAVAVKSSGKWGVVSLNGDMILPYEYDEIVLSETGWCYAQNAVFAKKEEKVFLFVNGAPLPETYEDARPFENEGWAAVKKNGKWGFIDTNGEVKVDFQFDDARSYGQHLAAVKDGEKWGYISLYGKMVIEPVYINAKSFTGGYAPVLTERGWQFISLLEE